MASLPVDDLNDVADVRKLARGEVSLVNINLHSFMDEPLQASNQTGDGDVYANPRSSSSACSTSSSTKSSLNTKVQDTTSLQHAAQCLRDGLLVAMPTETVYGLAANALDEEAVMGIFRTKGRPADNPLIIHISSLDMLYSLYPPGWALPSIYLPIVNTFWPGPLTILLPCSPLIPKAVVCGQTTMAVRMPSHPVALALIEAAGVPLAAPSANSSGRPSPTTAAHVMEDLMLGSSPSQGSSNRTRPLKESPHHAADNMGEPAGQHSEGQQMPSSPNTLAPAMSPVTTVAPSVAQQASSPGAAAADTWHENNKGWLSVVIDAGPCRSGVESTVLDGLRNPPVVLRPGGVTYEQLCSLPGFSSLQVYRRDFVDANLEEAPTTPGMKYKHYSPDATVVLLDPEDRYDGERSSHLVAVMREQCQLQIQAVLQSLGAAGSVAVLRSTAEPGTPCGITNWVTTHPVVDYKPFNSNGVNSGDQEDLTAKIASSTYSTTSDSEQMCLQPVASSVLSVPLLALGTETMPVAGSNRSKPFGSNRSNNSVPTNRVVEYVMGSVGDSASVARELFKALRLVDELKVAVVVVEGVTEKDEGLAVMNRLRKAASKIINI
ncbi:hypothetical protein CEUSTIGMA_g5953.t1 [Chlamydomonas eustigma]|uniref:Threonylcarbamoyl-AMP synthase n=1 Tax=Chlamydomonas eustigma TaxID=1157962 RepID=A0A250X611_9CHLO|nr:hypothetical protein CEUSTIGMA_g5953.t1 [Chlamydomonas eustigma]|eukprot:GAX78513.1 hypothetical protein CEUSTIGMA_g5953.t1 [Chlamydomonas eustigma]